MRVRGREGQTEIETETDTEREWECRQTGLAHTERKTEGDLQAAGPPPYSHLRRENHRERPTQKQ